MNIKNFKSIAIALTGIVFSFSSCISTETIEPQNPKDETSSDEIVLNLSAPKESKTRADQDHHLRFVAKLFPLKFDGAFEYDKMQRAEILGDKETDNKITFKVESGKNYKIVVFADYIPDANKQNDRYKDYYYDTSSTDSSIAMNTTPGTPGTQFSTAFFNNDNYDCFGGVTGKITKEDQQIEINLTLERVVAKLQWVDTSQDPGTLKTFKFDALQYFKGMELTELMGNDFKTSNPTINAEDLVKSDECLVFFYTFAQKTIRSLNIGFTTTISENRDPNTVTVEPNYINIQKNYKTIVKGNFLAQKSGAVSDNTPSGDATTKDSDEIILHLSFDDEWAETK